MTTKRRSTTATVHESYVILIKKIGAPPVMLIPIIYSTSKLLSLMIRACRRLLPLLSQHVRQQQPQPVLRRQELLILLLVVLVGPPWTITAKCVASSFSSSSSSFSASSSHSYCSSTKWAGRRSCSGAPTPLALPSPTAFLSSSNCYHHYRSRGSYPPRLFQFPREMIAIQAAQRTATATAASTTLDEDGRTMAKNAMPASIGGGGGAATRTVASYGNGDKITLKKGVEISIEYCSACRWMLRASWIATELLTTFVNDGRLESITLIPTGIGGGGTNDDGGEGGIFRVSAFADNMPSSASSVSGTDNNHVVLWDRKVMSRFPESKEIKQLVRDIVDPAKDLGHSDVEGRDKITRDGGNTASEKEEEIVAVVMDDDCIECKEREETEKKEEGQVRVNRQPPPLPFVMSKNQKLNRVTIEYFTGGGSSIDSPENGLYRAAYYANELLSMVYERNTWWKKRRQSRLDGANRDDDDESPVVAVDSVSLIPNRNDRDLLMRVKLNDHDVILFEQSSYDTNDNPEDITTINNVDGRSLRKLVRDTILSPLSESDAGKKDAINAKERNDGNNAIDMMDDDAAEQARKYFGVL